MRQAFVHEASLQMPEGGDAAAPGAAVTVALCGHWEHDPPCRVPHHTEVLRRDGGDLLIRVVFACEAEDAEQVGATVSDALGSGHLGVPAPDGTRAMPWVVLRQGRATLSTRDRPLADRLAGRAEA